MAKSFRMPVNVREYPVYSKAQERKTFFELKYSQDEKIKKEAKDNLVLHNMGLVYSIIKELTNNENNAEPDTLISYGVEGLIKAIDKFELAKNTKFSTYAYMWVKKYVRNGIHEQAFVRLPDGMWEKIAIFQKVQGEIKNVLEREPTYRPFSIDGAEFSEMEDALVNGDYGFTPAMYKKVVMAWNYKNPNSLNALMEGEKGRAVEFLEAFEDVEGTRRTEDIKRHELMRTEFNKIRYSGINDAEKIADIFLYMLEHPTAMEKEVVTDMGLKDRTELRILKRRGSTWLRDNSVDLTLQYTEIN